MLGTPHPENLGFLCSSVIRMMVEVSFQALVATPSLARGFSVPGTVWGHISKQEEGRKPGGPPRGPQQTEK